MKNVLILDAAIKFNMSEARLGGDLVNIAKEELKDRYDISVTELSSDFKVEEEVCKLEKADIVLIHFPVWWMSMPWQLKRYFDYVLTKAYDMQNAGQISLNGKKYMLSMTFGVGEYMFNELSLDDSFAHIHNSFRFVKMSALPTHACFSVSSDKIEVFKQSFLKHLKENF